MPVHKVPGGYKWGKTGKVYPNKKDAEKQARAIYANGYKGVNEGEIMTNSIKLSESELKAIIAESVKRILQEDYWSNGDVNPKVMQSYQKGLVNDRLSECKQKLGEYAEEMLEYAKAGHIHQVDVLCEKIKTCTKLVQQLQQN